MFDFPLPRITAEIRSVFLKGDKGDPGDTGPAGPQGEPGKAPRVGENDNWETYDNETQAWTDTGVCARSVRSYNELIDVPETFPPDAHRHEAGDVSGLSTVATSGAYADLTGAPEEVSQFENDANYQTDAQVAKAIDNIEIGGRNYITGSSNEWREIPIGKWSIPLTPTYSVGEDGDFKPEDKLIYSIEIDNTISPSSEMSLWISFYNDGSKIDYSNVVFSGEKRKMVVAYTIPKDAERVIASVGITNEAATGIQKYRNAKLERGNKATDWSPAPEDVNEKIRQSSGNLFGFYKADPIKINKKPSEDIIATLDESINGITIEVPNGTPAAVDNNYSVRIYNLNFPVKKSRFYSFSADISSTKDSQIGIDICDYGECAFDIGTEKRRCTVIADLGNWVLWDIPSDYSNGFVDVTFKSDVPEDTSISISNIEIKYVGDGNSTPRKAAVTYDYGGRNLKEIFGTPEALHNALAAEDYSQISVGDYWPITLNGTFWDYGSYTVKSGAKYYSNDTLQTEAGNTAATYEGTYVSDTAVSFSLSGSTYYVSTSDCLDHFERTCTNVTVNLEVAGINHYWRYGNGGELAGNKPHIVFVSRDCLPFTFRMRKGSTKWEDATAENPWIGSALFKTLNDKYHGIIKIVNDTEIGNYIKAMNVIGEVKSYNSENAASVKWFERGELFLPLYEEVYGYQSQTNFLRYTGLKDLELFIGSKRHISKSLGEGGTNVGWWTSSTVQNSASDFEFILFNGCCGVIAANINTNISVPICFVFA